MQKQSSSRRTVITPFAAVCLLMLGAQASLAQRPEDRPLPPPPPVHAEFKFDFGPGPARDGYVKVRPEEMYSSERGYGFDFGSKPLVSARGGLAIGDNVSIGTGSPCSAPSTGSM